ncbi:hypothetical protein GCK72_009546 [Caenorhabditis remanei]|uniref:Uncharacterized protein n=2 Tax=Caenorhabditis remanei TaxID=31234 RepID=E3LS38_CAERE|nr:hypothetical protein GCK72_009546 [Caenorhabditis remanei]EFP09343.1 hypothetical protein CRE_25532 [Caenorhabditis remanei]KAF1761290.1 hypothetical protein GCK72_009546 [Caenorhabditis remanei]
MIDEPELCNMKSCEQCEHPSTKNKEEDKVVADNYINLGEIQAATAPTSETPASQPGSSPASAPPSAPPKSAASGSAPGSAPQPSKPTPPAQASVFPDAQAAAPPPPPPENALAAVSAASPPKDAAPVAINPVHAPQLKLFEDVNFDSDGKSSQALVGKGSKGSASDPRKRRNSGTKEDGEEYKKPKAYYVARICYGSCFSAFFIVIIIWGLVTAVALNVMKMDLIENWIMSSG